MSASKTPLLGLALLAVAAVACSSSSSGSSASLTCAGTLPTGSASTLSAQCASCASASCASQASAREQACADYLSCVSKCDCGDGDCIGGCSPSLTSTCNAARKTLDLCETSPCASECGLASSGSGSGHD